MQLQRCGRLACDFIRQLCRADRDVDVVVVMPVHLRRLAGGNLDVEHADLTVGEDEVMVRLRGDLNFGGGLSEEDCGQEDEDAMHGRDCSIAGDEAVASSKSPSCLAKER